MYLEHFQLEESPFSITPDPRFVFFTERHREALAHLLYGLGEGGGFVQLTGEVGTGKTTICRALLRQLPEQVDVALIFNPQLTVRELLETLCTELHIELPRERLSIKRLIDRLYEHLLDANARGRRTVLIIDEAQNLSAEVLEEVRLLTNLETDDAKLLQVFLIGQPELRGKLARQDLRQIAQRITARYHLEPLDRDETRLYIRHRMSVAGCSRDVFTSRAADAVHRLTGGIPRRVNIVCDRALLGAYATDAQRVSPRIVVRASREVEGAKRNPQNHRMRFATAAVAVLAILGLAGLALRPDGLPVPEWIDRAYAALGTEPGNASAPADPSPQPPAAVPPESEVEPASPVAAAQPSSEPSAPAPPPAPGSAEPVRPSAGTAPVSPPEPESAAAPLAAAPPPSVDKLLAGVHGDGWLEAVLGMSEAWQIPPPSVGVALCDWAREHALACYSKPASWTELRRLDLPTILKLDRAGDDTVHALLLGLSTDEALVLLGGREQRVARLAVERAWHGEHVLLWRPPLDGTRHISLGQKGTRVHWLRTTLAAVDGTYTETGADAPFDGELLDRVKAFQRQRDLSADGVVGARTFMHLSSAAPRDEGRPSLAASMGSSPGPMHPSPAAPRPR